MNKIKTEDQAIKLFADLQKMIQEEAGKNINFRFEFIKNEKTLEIELGKDYLYYFSKKRNTRALKFSGATKKDIAQKFLDFFTADGEAKIYQKIGDNELAAGFHWNNGWVVEYALVKD